MKDLDIASNFMFDTASYSRGTTIGVAPLLWKVYFTQKGFFTLLIFVTPEPAASPPVLQSYIPRTIQST
jgi:hypothetical protein